MTENPSPGERVRVIAAIEPHVHDVSRWIGSIGHVMRVDPEGPAPVRVRFPGGGEDECFFAEELQPAPDLRCMCCQETFSPAAAHWMSRYNDRPICVQCYDNGGGTAASDVVYVPGSA